MAASGLRVERTDDVVRCTLDRPPLNLLEPGIIRGLRDAFVALAAESGVRVAVIEASGRAFTAGMDVRVLAGLDVASAAPFIATLHDAIDAVHRAPFPVIAAVHGACFGAGFELALACDLRLAATGAMFGLPEVKVGVPSVIQAALLPAMVGPGRAAAMLLTGEAVGADDALAWGLVNRVVPAGELRAAVDETVQTLLRAAPAALRLQKELIVGWRQTDLTTAVRMGIRAFAGAYTTGEPQEGARAFLEKRPPRFTAGS
jgi:enoyl-CoA hydratase